MSIENKFLFGPKNLWEKRARDIVSGKISVTMNDIPLLLEWIQDLNWPGANIIVDFLVQFDDNLIEHFRKILKSDDKIWIYGLLSSFRTKFSIVFWQNLKRELLILAYKYDEDFVHIEALKVIGKYHLDTEENIRMFLRQVELIDPDQYNDYMEIERLLK